MKYSNATRAAINLTYDNKQIQLLIQDNGTGFDTSQETAGNGIKNMKRRAEEMKWDITVDSQAGRGTRIGLVLPA